MDDALSIEESELGYLYDFKDRVEKLIENEKDVRRVIEGRLKGETDVKRKLVYERLLSDASRHMEYLEKIGELLASIASDEEEHISLLKGLEYSEE